MQALNSFSMFLKLVWPENIIEQDNKTRTVKIILNKLFFFIFYLLKFVNIKRDSDIKQIILLIAIEATIIFTVSISSVFLEVYNKFITMKFQGIIFILWIKQRTNL